MGLATGQAWLAAAAVLGVAAGAARATDAGAPDPGWRGWLGDYGHDTFKYPGWIQEQRHRCDCAPAADDIEGLAASGSSSGIVVPRMDCVDSSYPEHSTGPLAADQALTWCIAKQWLLDHMPDFDKVYMPPSVSVDGDSMFDDQIAFALMAENASKFSSKIALKIRLPYILPYSAYHEARANWRPLFFAKYYSLVENATSTAEAMSLLVAPNVFLNWTGHRWDADPGRGSANSYEMKWNSYTSPPVIDPFSFVAYGYASCSGWATFISYMARSVGIPARQAGTPCWNTTMDGVDYSGLAIDNPNVSLCWHGGVGSPDGTVGGKYLNNHNWIEFWDDAQNEWVFVNDPPNSAKPDSGICSWNRTTGCDYSPATGSCPTGGPGAASRDHEIFAYTWSDPHDDPSDTDGGPVLDVKDLRLSSGEAVSPLVWSPRLASPMGNAMRNVGLRVVNRTDYYRCRLPPKA